MAGACCMGGAASAGSDGTLVSFVLGWVIASMSALTPAVLASTLVAVVGVPYVLLLCATPRQVHTTAAERTYVTAAEPDRAMPLPTLDDAPTVQLSIVVPMYNEAERLGAMLDDCIAWLEAQRAAQAALAAPSEAAPSAAAEPLLAPLTRYEVLLVDDGSRDTTCDVALAYAKAHPLAHGAEIRLTRLRQNRGKGAAVRHGVLHARGHFILFADADGATRFRDIQVLAAEMARIITPVHQGMVVGSRAHLVTSDAVVKRSFLRNLLMRCFHLVLALLMRPPTLPRWSSGPRGALVRRLPRQPPIQDTQCGFKLFSRASARLLFPLAHIDRWIFDVELLMLAEMACRVSEAGHVTRAEALRGDGRDPLLRLPLPVAEIAVHWTEIDGSKIHLLSDSVRMARDLLVMRLNYGLQRWRSPPSIYSEPRR